MFLKIIKTATRNKQCTPKEPEIFGFFLFVVTQTKSKKIYHISVKNKNIKNKEGFRMAFEKVFSIEEVCNRVYALDSLHKDSVLKPTSKSVPKYDDFGTYGLSSAGSKVGFPASFVDKMANIGHEDLANKIIQTRMRDYQKTGKPLLLRKWGGLIEGVLTNKYGIFDDTEVMDILSTSNYLRNSEEIWVKEDPSMFHARFISPNHLTLPGDDSPLSMAVFVDNSMVGMGSFKIRFGLYRWACTNGMISGLKSFEILKQVHKTGVQFGRDLEEILVDVPQYEVALIQMATRMSQEDSSIRTLSKEQALAYIEKKLSTSQKISNEVYEKYVEYGGRSQWHLVNAITDKAHDLPDAERIKFETLAMRVA